MDQYNVEGGSNGKKSNLYLNYSYFKLFLFYNATFKKPKHIKQGYNSQIST